MRPHWKHRAAALAAALALSVPGASAAQVEMNGTPLGPEQAWVEDGASRVTLRAFAQTTGCELTWSQGTMTACLTGEGLELKARPGAPYIIANGARLAVEGGVRVTGGVMHLPLTVLAAAAGAELTWDPVSATAQFVSGGDKVPSVPIYEEDVPGEADPAYDEETLYWLSRVISAESRGEPLEGQIAVGNVVLNRVRSDKYPNTVKEVVFDRRGGVQFEPTANGTIYDEPTASAVQAAKLCLDGADQVGDAIYFYAPALSAGAWIVKNCTYIKTIGCHKFYK